VNPFLTAHNEATQSPPTNPQSMKNFPPPKAVAAAKPVGAFRDGEPRSLFSRKPKFVLDALAKAGVSRADVDSAFAADDLDFLVSKGPAVASAPVEARPGPTKAVSGQAQTSFAATVAKTITAPMAKTVSAAEFGRMSRPERDRFIREGGHIRDSLQGIK